MYTQALQGWKAWQEAVCGGRAWMQTWKPKSRGSHLYVACWSVCDWDQDFWLAKSVLDRLIVSSKALDRLIFYWSKVNLQPRVLNPLIFAVQRSPWSLDRFSKWALIAWFYFDPGRKRFYTGPLESANLYQLSVKSTPRISLMPRPSRTCEKEGLVFWATFLITWCRVAPQSEGSNQILERIIVCAWRKRSYYEPS